MKILRYIHAVLPGLLQDYLAYLDGDHKSRHYYESVPHVRLIVVATLVVAILPIMQQPYHVANKT